MTQRLSMEAAIQPRMDEHGLTRAGRETVSDLSSKARRCFFCSAQNAEKAENHNPAPSS